MKYFGLNLESFAALLSSCKEWAEGGITCLDGDGRILIPGEPEEDELQDRDVVVPFDSGGSRESDYPRDRD